MKNKLCKKCSKSTVCQTFGCFCKCGCGTADSMKNKSLKNLGGIDLVKFKSFIFKGFGKKCKDYSIGCVVCQVHRIYEDLKDLEVLINE